MINAVSTVVPTQAAAAATPVSPKAPASKPQATSTDTYTASNAVKAALQELVETPAQTAQEARGGDTQAERLLTKEAAAKAAYEKNQ